MSTDSKNRREAKKKQAERAANQNAERLRQAVRKVEPHAELRDPQRNLLAGVVRRDGQWVLGMDGKIAGESDSAAHVLAMVMAAGELHERQGKPVRLMYSDALRDAANAEVAAMGQTFEQFKNDLVARLGGKLH
ncbi:MAG: hypothetical protein ACI4NW_01915 [Stenotrophomonas sp.]